MDIPLADGRRVRLDQIARSATPWPSRARSPRERQAGGRLRGVAHQRRQRNRGGAGRARGARRAAGRAPRHGAQGSDRQRRPGRRKTSTARWTLLYEGALLAALVVFLFLRDWRATMVTAAAMPVSLIPTFFVMKLVRLLAEHGDPAGADAGDRHPGRRRHRRDREHRAPRAQGKRRSRRRMEAADAIGLAVVATTMAIVVVFTPVSFMQGIPGQFFSEFGLTVAVAVLFSLLVARLLTPLMAAYLLKPQHASRSRDRPFDAAATAMRWSGRCATGSSPRSRPACSSSPRRPGAAAAAGFLPAGDRCADQVNIELPPGAHAGRDTAPWPSRRARCCQRQPNVTGVFSSIGGGSQRRCLRARRGGRGALRDASPTTTLLDTAAARLSRRPSKRAICATGCARFPARASTFGAGRHRRRRCRLVLRSDDPATRSSRRAGSWSATCARCSGIGDRQLERDAWCGRRSSCRPTSRSAADLGVTAAPSAKPCAWRPPATTTPTWPSSTGRAPDPDPRAAARRGARRPRRASARLTVPGTATARCMLGTVADSHRERAGADRPAQPQPQRDRRGRAERRARWARPEAEAQPADR